MCRLDLAERVRRTDGSLQARKGDQIFYFIFSGEDDSIPLQSEGKAYTSFVVVTDDWRNDSKIN